MHLGSKPFFKSYWRYKFKYDWLEMQLVHVVAPNYQISANCHINKSWVFVFFAFSWVIFWANYLPEKQESQLFFRFFYKFLVSTQNNQANLQVSGVVFWCWLIAMGITFLTDKKMELVFVKLWNLKSVRCNFIKYLAS